MVEKHTNLSVFHEIKTFIRKSIPEKMLNLIIFMLDFMTSEQLWKKYDSMKAMK